MRTSLAIAVLLVAATIAEGGVSVKGHTWGDGVYLGDGLWSYTVRLVADNAADKVAAFDASFDGPGPLNQIQAFGILPTPDLGNAAFLSADDLAKDSHFLLTPAQEVVVIAPAETATSLSAVIGIYPSVAKLDLPLAQIVVKGGDYVWFSAKVANSAGKEFTIGPTMVPYPVEPGTMALVGLGALLLRRRR